MIATRQTACATTTSQLVKPSPARVENHLFLRDNHSVACPVCCDKVATVIIIIVSIQFEHIKKSCTTRCSSLYSRAPGMFPSPDAVAAISFYQKSLDTKIAASGSDLCRYTNLNDAKISKNKIWNKKIGEKMLKYRRFPLLGRNSYDFITKIKMRGKPFDLPLYHPYAMAIYLFAPILQALFNVVWQELPSITDRKG